MHCVKRNRETEKLDAGNPLVRVCGGAGEVTSRLYPENNVCFAIIPYELMSIFSFHWFEPLAWNSDVIPVINSGRGSAWFINSEKWFLREYRRGGLPSFFIKKSYFFSGLERTRAFKEFRLLHELFCIGMPVPEPVAACVKKIRGLFYQCSIILTKIENAETLDNFSAETDGKVWAETGRCIRLFHDQGVFHADLNCTNIMVSPERIYLIDFDRGCRYADKYHGAKWKQSNLKRLRRSLDKSLSWQSASVRNCLWTHFEHGYGR